MKPELKVRSTAHRLGYRYRLHRNDLPGKPDLVFPARKKIIMVHGCFWHSHDDPACVDGQRKPKSNLNYWLPKLARNKTRDAEQIKQLEEMGWEVIVIWECMVKDTFHLSELLKNFLNCTG